MTDAASNDVQKGWGTQKSREITWHDPAPTTSMGASMAGLDFMRERTLWRGSKRRRSSWLGTWPLAQDWV